MKPEKKRKEIKKMTRAELEKRLEELEQREFYINMADRFTWEDREALEAIKKEKERIKKMLDR